MGEKAISRYLLLVKTVIRLLRNSIVIDPANNPE
jgi:hypothetical protein